MDGTALSELRLTVVQNIVLVKRRDFRGTLHVSPESSVGVRIANRVREFVFFRPIATLALHNLEGSARAGVAARRCIVFAVSLLEGCIFKFQQSIHADIIIQQDLTSRHHNRRRADHMNDYASEKGRDGGELHVVCC